MNKKGSVGKVLIFGILLFIAIFFIRNTIYKTDIQKPVCGNTECEVFGGINEFYSCPDDCGIICGDGECVIAPYDERLYCPQDCQLPGDGIVIPIPSKNYKVKVYYVYNNGERNQNVINNIKPTIQKASNLFENYNSITLEPYIEEVQIGYDIGDGHDVYYPYSERTVIWQEIDDKVNLEQDVNNFDGIWVIFAGTKGGAYGIDFKSPIYFDDTHFIVDTNGIFTAHEFLHDFGCKDINGGEQGCIMGDLYVTTISTETLCECADLFKAENYKKQTYNEYVDTYGTFSFFRFKEIINRKI